MKLHGSNGLTVALNPENFAERLGNTDLLKGHRPEGEVAGSASFWEWWGVALGESWCVQPVLSAALTFEPSKVIMRIRNLLAVKVLCLAPISLRGFWCKVMTHDNLKLEPEVLVSGT